MTDDPNSTPQDPNAGYNANSAYNASAAYGISGPGDLAGQSAAMSNPEDLSQPLYGATFKQAITRFFKSYTRFSGRASRSEFWFAQLFIFLIMFIPNVMSIVGTMMNTAAMAAAGAVDPTDPAAAAAVAGPGTALSLIGGLLGLIIALAVIIPSIAITWRRLHDANFAGPFWFLNFVPFVGTIIVLVMNILPSKPEGRRFDV